MPSVPGGTRRSPFNSDFNPSPAAPRMRPMRTRHRPALIALLSVLATQAAHGESQTADRPAPVASDRASARWITLGTAFPWSGTWGPIVGIDVGADGRVWVVGNCRQGGCLAGADDPVLELDPASGDVIASFGAGILNHPQAVAVDQSGNIWVADAGRERGASARVIGFTSQGRGLMTLDHGVKKGGGQWRLREPCDIAASTNGDIFVLDGACGRSAPSQSRAEPRVLRFDGSGQFLTEWAASGPGPRRSAKLAAISVDATNRVYVSDVGNRLLLVFTAEGRLLNALSRGPSSRDVVADHARRLFELGPRGTLQASGGPIGIRVGPATDDEASDFIPLCGTGVISRLSIPGRFGYIVDPQGFEHRFTRRSLDIGIFELLREGQAMAFTVVDSGETSDAMNVQLIEGHEPAHCAPEALAIGPEGNAYAVTGAGWGATGNGTVMKYGPR